VSALVELADTVKGLRVLETGGSDLCFPADHRASLGLRYGNEDSIKTADFIICLDVDVPWIPTQCKPKSSAKIVHIDVDPLKQQMPVFYIPALARYKADAETAIRDITAFVKTNLHSKLSTQVYTDRWSKLGETHKARIDLIKSQAQPSEDGTFNCSYLMSQVRHHLPQDTIWAVEAVTNTAFVADQISATEPGSFLNCGGGGLGWSGGGALGIKLATDSLAGGNNKGKFVCQVVGDGTYLFSVPGSVYWIAQRYNLPILSIVLNNKGTSLPLLPLLA
jgi:thiamine pyrophosphate-dependent acetolactate synthase large subunit-like protein